MVQKIRAKLPEIAVILLCMIILGFGVSQKEGYHMDELLSFELANAEFNPWIVPTQPEGRLAKFVRNEIDGKNFGETLGNLVDVVADVLQNGGSSRLLSYKADVYEEPVWITAEQFQDYIMVDSGDDFSYLSVYFNVKDDNHPPIHFMLLHTMSSLFQGKMSPVMGCVINMAAVAVSMVFLMKIGRLLAVGLGMEEQGRTLGLLAALLYGMSAGGLASVLLIRMYCVMTCFCVISFYYHLKKWQESGFQVRNKGLIAVTVLGFLTQYFFLFYCMLLAAVTVVLLWCHNRQRELWCYVRSMLCAAIIGVVCFPFSILHVFSSGRGVEALENLSAGLAGYGERLLSFATILGERTFGCGLLLVLLLAGGGLIGYLLCGKKAKDEKKRRGAYLWLLLLPMMGYFLLAARMSPYLVDRYIMAIFPFVVLTGAVVCVALVCPAERRSGRKLVIWICGLLLVVQTVRLLGYDGSYLYTGYTRQEELAEAYEELPCICVYDGVNYYENLTEFAHYSRTLLVKQDELLNRQDKGSLAQLEQVVVLVKDGVDCERMLELLAQEYHLVLQEELLSESVHGDRIYLLVKDV